MSTEIIEGDCLAVMRGMEAGSVQCCVTSPPYWGLRDYGTAKWEGGDPGCDHKPGRNGAGRADGIVDDRGQRNRDGVGSMGGDCGKCGARRIDGQIGLEPTPDAYVMKTVEVFREVRRVLRDDGTLWLNLGDSYSGGGRGNYDVVSENKGNAASRGLGRPSPKGLKPKDLVGIPWRVAFALQADGWYLRQDIIWHKPNPMPESVTDRCTKSHEYIFLLSKSARYFYDAEAIKEPAICAGHVLDYTGDQKNNETDDVMQATRPKGRVIEVGAFRNKRDVWTVATHPYPEAHFATYPPALIRPCILAGTSDKGRCPTCGAPWEREVEKERTFESGSGRSGVYPVGKNGAGLQGGGETGDIRRGPCVHSYTTGWVPSCSCQRGPPVPCVVLDPFAGAGTTGVVCMETRRDFIGIELNPEYVKIAEARIAAARSEIPLLAGERNG